MLYWIVLNETVFDIETELRLTKLFEIELFWHLSVQTKTILILY